MLDWDNVPAP
uniref:Uncharacterized protein n=1 Tax=Arundo donax TaxID=35708 RepID=A0A0A9FAS6_ARUDO